MGNFLKFPLVLSVARMEIVNSKISFSLTYKSTKTRMIILAPCQHEEDKEDEREFNDKE